MFVKVCGMSQTGNIRSVASLDLDALGFIFYPKSPRYCMPMLDRELLQNLSESVKKVGVFVDESLENICSFASTYSLDSIQLHGSESPEMASLLVDSGLEVWKAFGIHEEFNFKVTQPYQQICKLLVFDTKSANPGGSGLKFNWGKLEEYQGNTPFLLSGGIKPEDLHQLLQINHPMCLGLDLNSGFEMEPGLKNVDVLKSFLSKIKQI